MLTAAEILGTNVPALHIGAQLVEGRHWRDDSEPERVRVGVMPRTKTDELVMILLADGRFRSVEQITADTRCRADGVRKCLRRRMAKGELVLVEVAGFRLFGLSNFEG